MAATVAYPPFLADLPFAPLTPWIALRNLLSIHLFIFPSRWDDGTIALLANWGPIMYLVAFLPTAWLLAKSVRKTALIAAALLVAGALARVFTLHRPEVTYLAHLGQV